MAPQNDITLRFLAEPSDMNFSGQVHGGTVMKWIDQAGYTCAAAWSKSYCVTVYVGGIRFYHPVHIGDLVEVHAKVIYTGRTSMHIAVDVWAHDPKADKDARKTTHCIIIFVAVDDAGNTTPVPAWEPVSEEDTIMHDYAKTLMELRKEIDDTMRQHLDN